MRIARGLVFASADAGVTRNFDLLDDFLRPPAGDGDRRRVARKHRPLPLDLAGAQSTQNVSMLSIAADPLLEQILVAPFRVIDRPIEFWNDVIKMSLVLHP